MLIIDKVDSFGN